MRPTDFGFPWTADDVPGTTGNLPGFRHGAVSGTDSDGRPVARANMAFCDGHVESLTWDGLRMGKPGADSRWKWWSNASPP